jgi:hypothetical protein
LESSRQASEEYLRLNWHSSSPWARRSRHLLNNEPAAELIERIDPGASFFGGALVIQEASASGALDEDRYGNDTALRAKKHRKIKAIEDRLSRPTKAGGIVPRIIATLSVVALAAVVALLSGTLEFADTLRLPALKND